MKLSPEIYKEFEEIVGARYISQDPGVLETYRCMPSQSSAHYGPYWDHMTPAPMAVILPGCTEEVQGIVRLCNKYKIKFKAGGSFWGAMAYIGSDYSIQLDMRRMRKIEIDVKNQLAIIDPYVNGAMLQSEAMKYGFSCNIPGVGCSSSIVASASGWGGVGPSTVCSGGHKENLCALEWVLPNGELLRTGTAGSGDGWFCGEGPGPSTRAFLTASMGVCGEMGVVTKMAMRLYPWPGPAVLPSTGTVPAYKAALPDNFRCYTVCFPSWDMWAKALTMCYDSDLVYLGHRQFNMFGRDLKGAMIRILTDPDKQLCDLEELLSDPEVKRQTEEMKLEFQIVLAGYTKRDMELKEAILQEILKECNAWLSSMMLEPDIENWALLYLIRLGHKNLNYVMCGSYEGNFGLNPNLWVSASYMEEAAAFKKQWEDSHTSIVKNGGDSEMGSFSFTGGGGAVGWEFFVDFDAYDKDSVTGACDFIDSTEKWMAERHLGGDMGRSNKYLRQPNGYDWPQEKHNELFSKVPQPHVFAYQWKVREAINPNLLGGSYYRTLDPKMIPEDKR